MSFNGQGSHTHKPNSIVKRFREQCDSLFIAKGIREASCAFMTNAQHICGGRSRSFMNQGKRMKRLCCTHEEAVLSTSARMKRLSSAPVHA
jgi:hypothetical protein